MPSVNVNRVKGLGFTNFCSGSEERRMTFEIGAGIRFLLITSTFKAVCCSGWDSD